MAHKTKSQRIAELRQERFDFRPMLNPEPVDLTITPAKNGWTVTVKQPNLEYPARCTRLNIAHAVMHLLGHIPAGWTFTMPMPCPCGDPNTLHAHSPKGSTTLKWTCPDCEPSTAQRKPCA